MKVLIYTHKITNRIKYIFRLIFNDLMKTEIELTTDLENFRAYEGVKLHYGKKNLDDELFFAADKLLFERGIRHYDLSFIEYNSLPAFFPVYASQSVLPFDVFSASFYMVSRYEEYLPHKKDQYGRFTADESIAYQKGFLQKPLVNIWAREIAGLIQIKYPAFKWTSPSYKFIPTIDIDAAWAYRGKGFFRSLGGYLASAAKLDFAEISERSRVQTGAKIDPFDTYEFQFNIHKKFKLNPLYFILFADYGFNDKNIPVRNPRFQTLIKTLDDRARVGIHPSYNSNDYPRKLREEIEGLSKVIHRPITASRQHFLKIQLPITYRNLLNLDITDDYSLGFASQPGFRAGICSTFKFYDLDLDVATPLNIHPFAYMEGTLRDYMQVQTEDAIQIIEGLIKEVKSVEGTFISIWHNESLSNTKRWTGWQAVYESMITMAMP